MGHLGNTTGTALSANEKTKSGDTKILAQPHSKPGARGAGIHVAAGSLDQFLDTLW